MFRVHFYALLDVSCMHFFLSVLLGLLLTTVILMGLHVLHQDFIFWGITYQTHDYKECPSGEGIYSDSLGLCTYVYVHVFKMSQPSKCSCRGRE